MRKVEVTHPRGVQYGSVTYPYRATRHAAPDEWVLTDVAVGDTAVTVTLTAERFPLVGEHEMLASYDRGTALLTYVPGYVGNDLTPPADGRCDLCGTVRATRIFAVLDPATQSVTWAGAACHLKALYPFAVRQPEAGKVFRTPTHPQQDVDERVRRIEKSPHYDTTEALALVLALQQSGLMEPDHSGEYVRSPREWAEVLLPLPETKDKTSDRFGLSASDVRERLFDAEMLRLWVADDYEPDNDFGHTMKEACDLDTVPATLLGLLARLPSLTASWERDRAAKSHGIDPNAPFVNAYLGEPGERLTIDRAYVVSMRFLDSGSTLVVLRSPDGHRITWFASGAVNAETGDVIAVTGTVRRHEEFRGQYNTNLTRCRVTKVT